MPAKRQSKSLSDQVWSVGEIAVALLMLFVLFSSVWAWMGRAPMKFPAPNEVVVETVPAGSVARMQMPVLPLRQDCEIDYDVSYRTILHAGGEFRGPLVGGVPDFGPIGTWNRSFYVDVPIPKEIQPGANSIQWFFVWNCGIRDVQTPLPTVRFETLPAVN